MAFIHKLKFFSLTKEEQLGKLSKKKIKKNHHFILYM